MKKKNRREMAKKPIWKKQCSVCKKWVTDPNDYIHSLRLIEGRYYHIELCRTCRDQGN